jgi:hypothetical protein
VTLSIHNTSEKRTFIVERIGYFNAAGQLIEKYLPQPIALKPCGAIQSVVRQFHIRAVAWAQIHSGLVLARRN